MENKQFPEDQEPVIEELTFSAEEPPSQEPVPEPMPAPEETVEESAEPSHTPEDEKDSDPDTSAEIVTEEVPGDVQNDVSAGIPESTPTEITEPPSELNQEEPPVIPSELSPEEPPVILSELSLEEISDILSERPSEPEDRGFQAPGADFSDMLQNPEQPKIPEKKTQNPRIAYKGRPKRKKGEGLFGIPNILSTVVWLALIVVIGVTAGRMLWICAADVLAFGREDKAVTVTIYEADTMDDIIDKLYDAGLIRYKGLFSLYAGISDAEEDIKPGIYDLNTRYDYHALVNFMSPRSSREVIQLTIPEGYTCRQIFALLEESRICTAVDLAAFAANGDVGDYWFLEHVARGAENSLEGFLFPDTYEFYKNSTPAEAIGKMLDNFETRFSEEMRAQIDTLNANLTGNYGVREIVIVASLIEKESAAPAESPAIAGVIYNRLFNWEFPALLNIDAAIVYAQGGDAENINTSLDSPYNTYLNTGLTPTPISNPGLSSLQAALQPESHNYYYYVLNPQTGMHQFSTTQAEHDAWIAQFYND